MSSVTRTGRILDLVGLFVFLAGSGFVTRAWFGFREVPAFQATSADPPWAAIQLADGFLRIQRVGVALMLVGVGVFVYAWWAERRRHDAGGGAGVTGTTAG